METALFWIVWGVISFWALKTFYFSYKSEQIRRLRLTALSVDLAVLILFLLPWLPLNNETGWALVRAGHLLATTAAALVTLSAVFFVLPSSAANKAGTLASSAAAIVFIAAMINLMPTTYSLTLTVAAPIVAGLLLLANAVVALLLWQQLQLKERST
ncbi:hypothetical protein A3H16_00495 [Candidatus Kaiserbacteria bacterium RIFCSPLOWO2_12_FULL_53_8]|uniref:Uncharacterized protein n=2 Tax=Candidatus Kaiseribacteriota TaxID=1752734 RepID=A0A1F6CXS7_9BACT|nr:MAG: hypothetical protein A2851_03365 [Candidatus Kaiserbacteria bacterium RIFCSPHIGHO2_01_FULL_53_29]OGG92123.1 MAG: hypothetical protein A3H16_00495 [Candidatus Kaiserbacteria bacterium RIFCSPLOWO2_12_FULL_53_8]